MRTFKNLLIVALLTSLFVSCGKESTKEPEDTTPLFTMAVGNEYSLKYYSLDAQNKPQQFTGLQTTLKITEERTMDGKDGYVFMNYDGQDLLYREIYSADDNSIFIHSSSINDMFEMISDEMGVELPFTLEKSWVEIYKREGQSWTAYETEIDQNYFGNFNIKGTFKIEVTKTGEEKMNISAVSHNCYKTMLKVSLVGEMYVVDQPAVNFPIEVIVNQEQWFAREIGKVLTRRHHFNLDLEVFKADYDGIEIRMESYIK